MSADGLTKWVLLPLFFLISISQAGAVDLIVLNARGPDLKVGMKIDSTKPVTLKEGEKLTVIGPDGKSKTLKGPFSGLPMPHVSTSSDPAMALASLVATRDARTSSVGVVRSGTATVKIPEPWLIDVTRAGPRCLIEGEQAVWWRPESQNKESFTVFPADRSWQADFVWQVGQDRQPVPPLSKFEGNQAFVVRYRDKEYGLSIVSIPKGIDNKMVLISWMLDEGCIQQADALLEQEKMNLLSKP